MGAPVILDRLRPWIRLEELPERYTALHFLFSEEEKKRLGISIGLAFPKQYDNLPRIKSLIGRQDDLSTLAKLLKKNNQVVIFGMGGVGKTELVKIYAKQHLENLR
ncbi:MAG: hypothetical protein F6K10_40345 [Moorea sp. SIO2B7]|nr:hypothetical protein [Moorena sp. SIO2B7]